MSTASISAAAPRGGNRRLPNVNAREEVATIGLWMKQLEMNIPSKTLAHQHVHFVALALALSLGGCLEVTPESDVERVKASDTVNGLGGDSAVASVNTGDSAQLYQGGSGPASGGNAKSGASAQPDSNIQTGGVPDPGLSAQTGQRGGSVASDTKAQSGGSVATDTKAQSGGTYAASSEAPSGGKSQVSQTSSQPSSGGIAAGGSSSKTTTDSTHTAGGTTSATSVAQAGASGSSEVLEPICADEEGGAIPYDYSMGLVSEYSFELSMSCEIGGYLLPLVLADPEGLSEVNAFALNATDWYRAKILGCADANTSMGPDSYGLLPTSSTSELSAADVDASVALFLMVIDRHDTRPDAVSGTKKEKIKDRLKAVKARAVHSSAVGLTQTLTEPDCVPSAPTGG